MSVHPGRVVASLALLAGGFIVGVAVLAIAFAQALVNAGMTVRPSDAALLGDLIPVLPFIAGFALVSVLSGVGVLAGQGRADALAIGTSVVAVVTGAIGLALIVVGRDPFASTSRAASTADGLGIIGTFVLIYLVAIVALAVARSAVPATSGRSVAS